jgi:Zn-dependent protease
MTLISDPTETRAPPPRESTGSKIKKALGPIGVIGVVILKFIGKIKFILPILLNTGGSMVLMVGVYASIWGWKWAVGFVLHLLLHECGHLLVAKKFGLAVSAPIRPK